MAARSLLSQRLQASRLWQWMGSIQETTRPVVTVAHTPPNVTVAQAVEPEPVDSPKLGPNKLLVLGGSGFVGKHVCKEAVNNGLAVLSYNRSGRPSIQDAWANEVTWIHGSLFDSEQLTDSLKEVSAVISCVGGFGSNDTMQKINGDANIAAITAAADSGVRRFVYISAHDFGFPNFVLRGYYEGKKAAEAALRSKFPYGGVILRPGFIHGNRQVGGFSIPLSAIGSPLELLLKNVKPASQLPVFGPMFMPPVKVTAVAKAAVRAATDNAIPPGVLDVWNIIHLGDH